MLVNWKVNHLNEKDEKLQSPDYTLPNEKYWFFKHVAKEEDIIDVIGLECAPKRSKIEKKLFNFYITQTLKNIFKIRKYDVVISHGAQSGIVLAFLRRFMLKKVKHILIDVGAFQSASEKDNLIMKTIQFASKSIDYVIYHTSSQIHYYEKYFPWIVNKSKFVHYGEDVKYFDKKQDIEKENNIICIGYSKRDWKTLISAFNNIDTDYKLVILGKKIESANDRIISYDFLPLDQLIWQIQKAKIGILPLDDLNYSFGQMTFLQQGILKLPMIVSNSRSLRDYFVENETCIVFNSGNEKELKEKIESLILDEEKQKEISEKNYNYILNNLNSKIMAKNIWNIILSIKRKEG